MILSRSLTLKINYLLDQLLPPILRDSALFGRFPLRLLLRDKAGLFYDFKEKAPAMPDKEFLQAYRDTSSVEIDRPTGLNEPCIREILGRVHGESVLEVGCGQGYLARKLGMRHRVTAVDLLLSPESATGKSGVSYLRANVESLPFKDNAYDTVVCAHTLEHVQDILAAIQELRRVAARRLILVVPKQRPYRYTFDLHLHFFPYEHSLVALMGKRHKGNSCRTVGGDLFYMEDR